MRYYVLHNKRQYGPFDENEIRELLSAGILTYNDQVAPEGTLKFQSLAKTDLIFVKPADHVLPSSSTASIQSEKVRQETAATGYPETVSLSPATPTEPTGAENSRGSWRQTILGQAMEIFVSHIEDWLLILTVTLAVQGLLFSSTFSVVFRMLFPAPGDPIGVSFTGQVVEMVVVAVISVYTSSIAVLITILGTASHDGHRFFEYKLLLGKSHRKLPVFWTIAVGFAVIYVAVILSAALLPDRIALLGKYAAKILFLPVSYRLFAMPFAVILENVGLSEAYRISCKLLRGQFKPIFCAGLLYIALHTAIRLSLRKLPLGLAFTHLLQLIVLIYVTCYYQRLSSTALIHRRKAA